MLSLRVGDNFSKNYMMIVAEISKSFDKKKRHSGN